MSLIMDRQNFPFSITSVHISLQIKRPHCQLSCIAAYADPDLIPVCPMDTGTVSTHCPFPHFCDNMKNLGGLSGAV